MKILNEERVELPTPRDPAKPGLLLNVHLDERCMDEAAMRSHAVGLIEKESRSRYAGIAVVFWLQQPGRRERVFAYEE